MIRLGTPEGGRIEALVTALGASATQLTFGGAVLVADLAEITPRWTGEYLVLSRGPVDVKRDLHVGMRGDDVTWLRDHMRRLQGQEPRGLDEPVFDDSLRRIPTLGLAVHALVLDELRASVPERLYQLIGARRALVVATIEGDQLGLCRRDDAGGQEIGQLTLAGEAPLAMRRKIVELIATAGLRTCRSTASLFCLWIAAANACARIPRASLRDHGSSLRPRQHSPSRCGTPRRN